VYIRLASLIIAFTSVFSSILDAQRTANAPLYTTQLVAVEPDVRLEVVDWGGTGPALILLAGLGNDAHIFDTFAHNFTAHNHVYGITRRGFGASSKPSPTIENYNADRLGDDVLSVMATLHLDNPVLAGHSIAGEELSSIGSRYPDKVSGLIYLDASNGFAYYDKSHGDTTLDIIDLKKRIEVLQVSGPGSSPHFFQNMLASVVQVENDLRQALKLDEALPSSPQPTSTQAPLPAIPMAIAFGEQKYTHISAPILAIVAVPHDLGNVFKDNPGARAAVLADDLARTSEQANAFETGVPSAHVVRLHNAGHYIFVSNEAEVVRIMSEFLRNLQIRGALGVDRLTGSQSAFQPQLPVWKSSSSTTP